MVQRREVKGGRPSLCKQLALVRLQTQANANIGVYARTKSGGGREDSRGACGASKSVVADTGTVSVAG